MARRRTFTPEFKTEVVLAILSGQATAAEICRAHRIKLQHFSEWKAYFLKNAATVFQGDQQLGQAEERIAKLEHLVRRQGLELEVAHLPWRAVPGKKAWQLSSSASQRSAGWP